MRTYSVRDVCRSLGVKPHVLRYWEEQSAIVTPLRTDSGHRRWTAPQLNILHRMKHLISDLGMSIAAAEQQIIREANHPNVEGKARIERFRSTLVALRENTRAPAEADTTEHAVTGQAETDRDSDEAALTFLPAPPGEATPPFRCEPREWPAGAGSAYATAAHLSYRSVDGVPPLIVRSPTGDTLLARAGAFVRSEMERRGGPVAWLILVRQEAYAEVLEELDLREWCGVPRAYVETVSVPPVYYTPAGPVQLPPDVAVLERVLCIEQIQAWLLAHRARYLYLPSVTGMNAEIVKAALRGDAPDGVVSATDRRRRHSPVAGVDLPVLFARAGGRFLSGSWRREVYYNENDAENIKSVWNFERRLDRPDTAALQFEAVFPGRRPALWSPRWPRELDWIGGNGTLRR